MSDLDRLEKLSLLHERMQNGMRQVIIGQQDCWELMLSCLLAGGHALLIGVPGLAKTLMVQTLAQLLDLSFNRIQFTPDLMPADITGADIIEEDIETGRRAFRFLPGPVFSNIILADEINRTPPKTQAALLESMQEHQVTASGVTRPLPAPFHVLATQNPIEQEGTYPLPEAQLDRFMFNIVVDYPSAKEEQEIVSSTTSAAHVQVTPVISAEELADMQDLIRRVPAPPLVVEYAVEMCRASRPGKDAPEFVNKYVSWGIGPRGGQNLILGAKARAALDGRPAPELTDVRAVAQAALSHRLVSSFSAEAEGISTAYLVEKLVAEADRRLRK